MPTITQPVPATTQTQDQFNESWDRLLSELPAFETSMNSLASQTESDAADAAAAVAALAAAEWASGPYDEGDVVWSPTDHYTYRARNTGTLSTDPPDDPTNWTLLTKTGNGGADVTSSAVDVALTSTSQRLQSVTMTASGKKVTLAAATGLLEGGPAYIFSNTGLYKFDIEDNAGNYLATLQPNHVVFLSLDDNATAAGSWVISGFDLQSMRGNALTTINAVASTYVSVAKLTASKTICAFVGASSYLNAVVINSDSSFGTIDIVNAEVTTNVSITALTSTQAVVAYNSPTGTKKGYVLDVSVNTITPGVVATLDADANAGGTALDMVTSTQAILVYVSTVTTPTLKGRLLDVAASVITPGSELVISTEKSTISTRELSVDVLSTTKAIAGFKTDTTLILKTQLLDISGSTLTKSGSLFAMQAAASRSSEYGSVALSSTRALYCYAQNAASDPDLPVSIHLLDTSGTTPVTLDIIDLPNIFRGNSPKIRLSKISSSKAIGLFDRNLADKSGLINLTITDDDRIMLNSVVEHVGIANDYQDFVMLDTTDGLWTGQELTTNYLDMRILEVN